jgi:hypothetical protein
LLADVEEDKLDFSTSMDQDTVDDVDAWLNKSA